ncbi:MAG: LysR family transcriptional regulator [Oscillospiraceae bacterium]|nr:LysR family transcriptional regulator [Oscillospiraceae bacterium]
MNLMHLKYLVEVEKTGSITKAASSLFMGQPNLSKAIKEVENEVGAPIFKRISKGVEPTEKGVEFLKCAKAIIQQMDKMENLFKPEVSDIISFNVSAPRAFYAAQAFSRFVSELDRTGRFAVNFREANSLDTINGILEGEFNMGIIRCEEAYEDFFLSMLADKELKSEEIWDFSYVAVMSENSRLASKDAVTAAELAECIEVVHGDISVPYLSESYLKKTEKGEQNRVFVYDRGSQLNILKNVPDAFTWVSPILYDELKSSGLVQKRCVDGVRRNKDLLIHERHYHRTNEDKAFIEKLFQVRDEIEKQG